MSIRKELEEITKLNRKENIQLTIEYLKFYIKSIFQDPSGKDRRKELLNKLSEYHQIIKEENTYMSHIIKNIDKIKDFDELERILDELDILNESTYRFYDNILLEYDNNIYSDRLDRRIVPYRDFKTLLERTDYLEKVVALTITREELKDFYQQYDAWYYLINRTKIISQDIEGAEEFYGCYQLIKNNTLEEIKICVPPITNLKSLEINIKEYKNAIDLYSHIGKEIPLDFKENSELKLCEFKEKYLSKKNTIR